MFDGYLTLGGVEILNNARAKGYGESASCPVGWFKEECPGLSSALGQTIYTIASINEAPWYDPRNPESARFYGAYGLGMKNLSDSTRYAETTEGITDGGVAGASRRAGRSVRIRAWLSADGEDALEYGMAWLASALATRQCDSHGSSCGGASVNFFVACPPERASDADLDEYAREVESLRRYLHGVKTISGPLEVGTRQSSDGTHWGREVEFTLYAEQPGVYGSPRNFGTLAAVGEVVEDVLHNLVPYPSAELGTNEVIVAYNHVNNPSLELDATGWGGGMYSGDDSAQPAIGVINKGVVKGARSYVGDGSYVTQWVGDGKTEGVGTRNMNCVYEQRVMPGIAAGDVVTVTVWGSLVVQSGTPLASSEILRASYIWLNASGGYVGSSVSLGTATDAERAGKMFSLTGVVVPSGATGIMLTVQSFATKAYSSLDPTVNRDLRLYADAAGVIEEV